MNKPICILLCILLICLSIAPVFATDYTFDTYSSFVSAINSAVPFTSDSASGMFIETLSSEQLDLYNKVVSYYSISESNIIACAFADSTNYSNCTLITCNSDMLYGYLDRYASNNTYSPILYCYFQPGQNPTRYGVRLAKSNSSYYYSTANGSSPYGLTSTSDSNLNYRSVFSGFYTNNDYLNISPNYSYTDRFILDIPDNSGGGGNDPTPSYTFENITLSAPTVPYSPLYNQMMLARWDELSSKWPSQFSNVVRGEWVFTDLDNAEIMGAILQFGGLFETYANHSYDFYNNVSLNLANGMTALTSSAEELANMSDNIELLASIYASEQEIEAREAASDNQQAIVDNFLDSEGNGYVSPSDISSVSSMSDGYKSHMSTDAQPSGIWNIFNSNNFGWFSQETVNQLDTTTSNQRSINTFETPYLDEKIKDIYKSLGVNYDD